VTDQRVASCALNSRIANKAFNLILVPFGWLAQLVKAISHCCSSTWSVLSQKNKVDLYLVVGSDVMLQASKR
jgi:hypothetical protein